MALIPSIKGILLINLRFQIASFFTYTGLNMMMGKELAPKSFNLQIDFPALNLCINGSLSAYNMQQLILYSKTGF